MTIREHRQYTISVTTTFKVPDDMPLDEAAQAICDEHKDITEINRTVEPMESVLERGPDARQVHKVHDNGVEDDEPFYEWS